MRIPQKDQAYSRYNAIKAKLQQAAAKPSNESLFKQDGDRFELTQTVRFPFEGQPLVVKEGAVFDNDLKTRDKIAVETTAANGTVQTDTFEHFSERRGLIFKRDQEMLTATYSDRNGFNFSDNSATFEIK